MKICSGCEQPIFPMEAAYHSACADPFVLKAKDAEIENLRATLREIIEKDRTGFSRAALAQVARRGLHVASGDTRTGSHQYEGKR